MYLVSLLLMLVMVVLLMENKTLKLGEMLFDLDQMSIELSLSNTKIMFYMVVTMISLGVYMWSMFYMTMNYKSSFFYYSLLLFVISMLLLILSKSLFLVFIGWEGLGITSFILIVFYQNWVSGKGGLLTLLTNRLGDAMLLICMCLWMSDFNSVSMLGESMGFYFLLMLLVLTKSAQWPFSSWLPAAMAAPTPVSSLVHSSTLVTAGVWLVLRFMIFTIMNTLWFGLLSILTVILASGFALVELDAKKIVALSTLSQLGFMFLALSVGTKMSCFFHVVTHALAKANLFMVIGGLLHSGFSQQDSRFLSSGGWNKAYFLCLSLSLLSLSGWTFSSGFFSKELILVSGSYSTLTSFTTFMVVASVSMLTLAYCLKLVTSIMTSNLFSNFSGFTTSILQVIPIFLLSVSVVIMGFFFMDNMILLSFVLTSASGLYWSIGVIGLISLSMSFFKKMSLLLSGGFLLHGNMIKVLITSQLSSVKMYSSSLESSLSESWFLLAPQLASISIKLSTRSIVLLFVLGLFLMVV